MNCGKINVVPNANTTTMCILLKKLYDLLKKQLFGITSSLGNQSMHDECVVCVSCVFVVCTSSGKERPWERVRPIKQPPTPQDRPTSTERANSAWTSSHDGWCHYRSLSWLQRKRPPALREWERVARRRWLEGESFLYSRRGGRRCAMSRCNLRRRRPPGRGPRPRWRVCRQIWTVLCVTSPLVELCVCVWGGGGGLWWERERERERERVCVCV